MIEREIEVKAKVYDRKNLEEKLHELGCSLSSPIRQIDRIFIPKGTTIPTGKGVNVLRIRNEQHRILFTLKQSQENHLDKIEKEFTIDNEQQAAEAIVLLGFEESVAVEKIRRKCRYQDYEICVDEVSNLGTFVEIEKISSEDGAHIQTQLFALLKTLGVRKEDQVFLGYDVLLYQQQHLK